jgi:manganese/zinc/iron transport system permease protein
MTISYDAWLAIVGCLAAAACAIPGTFLMLRRLSLMGDAISHAVLPGLIIAYMISESRASFPMLVGAIGVGLFAAFATETLRRFAKVDESASIGIVFTSMFAVGLLLISLYADKVDLDPNCVLNGNLEIVPLDVLGSTNIPTAVLGLGVMLIANAAIVALLFKEFRICSFDPALAATQGFRPAMMHYLLMTMTALTCVVAFEAVGSILVVALLIVPAAAAHLLSDRLHTTLLLAVGIAIACALVGQFLATSVPGQFGLGSVSITGSTATVAGIALAATIVLSPKHGVIARASRRRGLTRRIAREDLLANLVRHEEATPGVDQLINVLRPTSALSRSGFRQALGSLTRDGLAAITAGKVALTDAGRREALRVLRSHRLWETYLTDVANVAADHTHAHAHRLEHIQALEGDVSRETRDPPLDPHRKPIPRGS